MHPIILVGIGSFAGGGLRYLLSQWITHHNQGIFPLHTLVVNVLGCLAIGLLAGFGSKHLLPDAYRLLLINGLLGGFTTFSTFSNETINLFKLGHTFYALTYIGLSIFLCLLATWLAMHVVKG